MGSQEDLIAELAGELRAAVAQSAPSATRQGGSPPGPLDAEEVRRPLQRAEAHLTPTIPPGVRLARAKGLVLRAARFLWRDQTSFNALSLEAMNNLRQGLEESRGALESLQIQMKDLRQDLEKWSSSWERRASIQDGRLSTLESAAPAPGAGWQGGGPPPERRAEALPAGVYSLFEERFRGSPQEVSAKQASYLPLLEGVSGPVLDVGCGRGEFLSMLRHRGIEGQGIESNPLSVEACRKEGLEVEEGDALDLLSQKEASSLGAVVAFQVVEHWTTETTFAFLREARRSLKPGGRLILETINTDSLSALKAFFLDPTHVRPVPPDTLRFLAETAGFVEAEIRFTNALPESARLSEGSENDAKLNGLLFAPQDYALVARAP
jgi:O-antigen chain-terminating methyltransferase